MIQRRDIVASIILTVITCGIYGLYWMYCLTEEVNLVSGDQTLSPGLSVLLTILTCSIYGYYWAYKMGKNLQAAKMARGMMADDKSILYLVFAILSLQIVNFCLMQDELNSMAG